MGINTAIITQSGGYEGIGLAIPSSLARRVVESLIKKARSSAAILASCSLHVSSTRPPPGSSIFPTIAGAHPARFSREAPRAQAGLKPNDVIVKLADHDVADPAGSSHLTAGLDAGAQVPDYVLSRWPSQTATVTIAELPQSPELLFLGSGLHERPAEKEGARTIVEIDRVSRAARPLSSACVPGCVSWPSASRPCRSYTR